MNFWHWEFSGLHLGTGWLIVYALFFAVAALIETRTTKRSWMMLFNAWACGVNLGRTLFGAALVFGLLLTGLPATAQWGANPPPPCSLYRQVQALSVVSDRENQAITATITPPPGQAVYICQAEIIARPPESRLTVGSTNLPLTPWFHFVRGGLDVFGVWPPDPTSRSFIRSARVGVSVTLTVTGARRSSLSVWYAFGP